jgi:hypothetical protein
MRPSRRTPARQALSPEETAVVGLIERRITKTA